MKILNKVSEPLSGLKYVISICGLIASCFGYAGAAINSQTLSALCLLLSLFLLIHVRENRALMLVMFIFAYMSYSILYANYIHPLIYSPYTVYRESIASRIALSSLLLFLSIICACIPSRINRFGYGSGFPAHEETNAVLVISLLIVLLLILIFGFTSSSELGSERGSQTAIFEYSSILFPIAILYSGNSKLLRNISLLVLASFCFVGLASGERVTALQLLFIAFFMILSSKFHNEALVFVSIIGLVGFTILGSLRAFVSHASMAEISKILFSSFDAGMAWDTAYSAWHTSITFILYGNMVSTARRSALFLDWLMSIFIGKSVPNSQLPSITLAFFPHSWGGILPVYFQFYLGPLGVVLIAIYTSILLRMVNTALCVKSRVGTIRTLASLYVAVTSFRWILYSPSQLTRGLALCVLCSGFAAWIDSSIRSRKVRTHSKFIENIQRGA